MRLWIVMIVAIGLGGFAYSYAQEEAAKAPAEAAPEGMQTLEQRMSYLAGYGLGRDMRQQMGGVTDFAFSEKALLAGLDDAMKGQQPKMNQQQIQQTLKDFQADVAQRIEKRGANNITQGKKFLEENKAKEGVKTTDSGLQYLVVKEGSGKAPVATSSVTVHYEGTLLDGSVFDSSYKRGEPATFTLNQVISGWTEGLQLMKEGGTFMLYIPSNLAYGDSPRSPGGPNSTLIFKVELIKVND